MFESIEFREIDVQDTPRYLEHLRRCMEIPCIMSPFLHVAFKDEFHVRRGYRAGLCWTKGSYYGRDVQLVPAGDWTNTDWAVVFRRYVPAGTRFVFVPSYAVDLWRRQLGESILVEDTPSGDWDYILSLERLKNFAGKKLQSFRRKCIAFEREYSCSIEPITPQIFPELTDFHEGSEKNIRQRHGDSEGVEIDDAMFYKALEYWEKLGNLSGFVVRIGGKIAAYQVDEIIDETYSIGLLGKADYSYKGVNQFAYWYGAKSSIERGIMFQNIMEDNGDDNLRMFKEHLDPLVLLKQYHVTYLPE